MERRLFTAALLAAPWAAQAQPDDLAARLRAGGCAVLLRHAQTDPGIGDPPGFRLDQCSSQRNLSEEGRAQSVRIGQWFKSRGLQSRTVQSSAWCRCVDTANLAFGRHTVWPSLNSFFGGVDSRGPQTAALRAALARIPAGQFEVWVTHQVNISALSGEGTSMGEGLVLDARGKMVARSTFT
ncbi:histidine phosphatase family protein [Polaromonas sp.]|uniref:histidine phosphatase family protein n=1 Tax=Polaromonas sp. TaxID=1869339 RepID=UPI00272FF6E6|nr:histidine phosphatase family protein [Polaromonas sp.]MDP1742241.1 histidine phosphatase family protein [Polaromonas sp.]